MEKEIQKLKEEIEELRKQIENLKKRMEYHRHDGHGYSID